MLNTYPVATICGTMKLFDNMLTVADELTRQGCMVLLPIVRKGAPSLSINHRIAALEKRDGKVYDHHSARHLNATPITNVELDVMHKAKIDAADRVVIVTDFANHVVMEAEAAQHETGFYFGDSTRSEIEHASRAGKAIEFARVERRDYRDTIIWLSPEVGTKLAAAFASA